MREESTEIDHSTLIENLRHQTPGIQQSPTANNTKIKYFVNPALDMCPRVFLRKDTLKQPFQEPYTGPHKVVTRMPKPMDRRCSSQNIIKLAEPEL